MSRFLIACSLVAALSSTAMARSVAVPAPFAQPPAADVYMPDRFAAPARIVDRATVRAKLLEQRATNLANFRAYVQRGVFPNNTYRKGKLNVWIDAAGNLCAAATMLNDSGLGDLVTRVGEQNNFIRLRDVSQGPLMDWMLMSGLTQAEIVAIQEPGSMVGIVRSRQSVEPMPSPILVDADLRGAEDVRLARRYKQVDAMIMKNQKRSLDAATDRLMKNPELAWKLING
ncbi:MAG: hypothetical protein H0T42_13300 [Deltaproteobacteria bacterium]|nr:hypothetical protein [Deltaproteobacteria bacterium]